MSPFPQPFLVMLFSSWRFSPAPPLRGTLQTDVRGGTAVICARFELTEGWESS